MKTPLVRLAAFVLLVSISIHGMAQEHRRHRRSLPTVMAGDSLVSGGYTLIFVSNYAALDTVTKQNMINAFFTVYPKEVDRFNKASLTKIIFFVDTSYKGVAETGNGMARFNPKWLVDHPQDIDVVTHEVMHVVQAYKDYNPGWLTEGIADYVRYVYGVNNKGGGWTLPNYRANQSYENAYRVTARFLIWVEKNKYNRIVDDMDKAMREGTYTPELWAKLTGKTVEALWTEYAQNPALELTYN